MWQRQQRRERRRRRELLLMGFGEKVREVVVGLVERSVNLEEVGGVSGGGELFGHVGGLL